MKQYPIRHLIFVGLSILVAGAMSSCGGAEDQGQRQDPAVPVRAIQVESRTLSETVRGIGTLQAKQTVEIRPEIDGTIVAIPFDEGKPVIAGDVLFELETSKLKQELAARMASLEAAHARRDDAERQLRQSKRLFEQNVTTRDILEQAQNNLRAAQAEVRRLESEVALAKERLNDTRITAPLDGLISEALVDVGDYVKSGNHLATLFRTDVLEIAFTLPERYANQIALGQSVALTIASYADRSFQGEVIFISPNINDRSRDFLVKADVVNPSALLKPGAFATAVVQTSIRENRPVVPEEALINTQEGHFVFVVGPDSKAVRRQVKTGLRNPGIVEITEGLSPGEEVVRTGHMRVSQGVTLNVITDEG